MKYMQENICGHLWANASSKFSTQSIHEGWESIPPLATTNISVVICHKQPNWSWQFARATRGNVPRCSWPLLTQTFGPGGFRVPPMVADGREAGHCFHLLYFLLLSSFFFLLHLLLFTLFRDTPEAEIPPPPIFWQGALYFGEVLGPTPSPWNIFICFSLIHASLLTHFRKLILPPYFDPTRRNV